MTNYIILVTKSITNKYKRKLQLCIMTFTLITNLTATFGKYSAIPSHLKKRTSKYSHHLKTRKCP